MCQRLTIGVLVKTGSAQFVKVLCTISRLNYTYTQLSSLAVSKQGDMGAWEWELGNGSFRMGAWEWEL